MYRPKNLPPSTLRLPKQHSLPGLAEFQFLLSEAEKIKGRTVEMPWLTTGQDFMLSARLDEDSYIPLWTFYKGTESTSPVIWQHASGDVNLIHGLCWQASAPDLHALGSTYVSATANESAPPSQLARQTLQNIDATTPVMRDQGKAIFEGELANMQIPTLLQSITMSKMTGRLQVTNKSSTAQIFFEDGAPMHAVSPETVGDQAIAEIIIWEEGHFRFYPAEKTPERTVKRRLDGLLMEGVSLLDQNRFLTDAGLKLESFVMKAHQQITEEEFRAALTRGAPLDMETQKRFYSSIDGRSTVLDILRRNPMVKVEWIPLMFNMVSCGLVTLVDAPPAHGKAAALDAVDIDRTAISSVVRMLTRPETGMFTYPAFLYFFEQEFFKCAAMGWPLTVLVFEMKLQYGDLVEAMPVSYVREAARRIEGVKRNFDILAHYETFDYALLLPNTYAKAARILAHRINEVLASEQLVPGPPNQIILNFGIASAPEDTQELGALLAAAREAKNRGRQTGAIVTLFHDVEIK